MGCISSTLFYGDSGEGKTANAWSWSKYVHQKTGKRIRLYTAEPAGLDTIGHALGTGIIDVWDLTTRPYPTETMDFAARGYWPDKDDATKLIPPGTNTWQEFGGFIYEGAAAFGEMLLDELRIKGAANEIIGAEKAPQQFTSGSLRVAGSNQTHYGIVQGRVRKAINDSQRLPVHVLWTTRELKVRDEDDPKKQYVYGPLLAGSAATLAMPAWFGHTIHISSRKGLDPLTKKERLIRRAYLTKHFDDGSDIPYLAQLRLPPEVKSEVPESIELTPDLEAITALFHKMDALREKAKQKIIDSLAAKK